MEMKWDNLPVLDWELAKRLAGNQIDLANDMLTMLTKDLPNNMLTINQLASKKLYPELLVLIHKLHGAACYCGAPRLKAVLAHFEMRLKNNARDEVPALVEALNTESRDLIKEFKETTTA